MSDFVKVLGFDDSAIDKKTGAPLAVRNAVGGAPNPRDRLASKYHLNGGCIRFGCTAGVWFGCCWWKRI